jgi:catechol 2,3-dioxygenase-like lactoylglutathione lyase family enzyme
MRLHHLALGARDVEAVARFYREVLGLAEERRHHTDDGALRSIWLDLGGARLMIEHTTAEGARVEGVGAGPFLIAVGGTGAEREAFERALQAAGGGVEDRTPYTSYGRDPEGNRVAVSTYPDVQAPPPPKTGQG